MKCVCKNWDEIHGFHSLIEYNNFIRWINDQITDGLVEEVPVIQGLADALFDVHHYICKGCNRRWRLEGPDAPYCGVFEVIKLRES